VWRSYTLKNMSEVQILETPFIARRDYDPKGSGFKNIHCATEREPTYLRIA